MEIQQQQFTDVITALTGLTEELKRCTILKQILNINLRVLQKANHKRNRLIIAAIMLQWKLGTPVIILRQKLGSPIVSQLLGLSRTATP